MTFWHNQKYESLEKSTLNGDLMRALPAKSFPWLLQHVTCQDTDGDQWQIKVSCLSIEGSELSQKIKAKISLEANCAVTTENLKKMNVDIQRLIELNLFGWNNLSEKYTLEITCLIDKIEEKTSEFYKVFFKKIQEKYPTKKKKEIITANIRNCRISNFS